MLSAAARQVQHVILTDNGSSVVLVNGAITGSGPQMTSLIHNGCEMIYVTSSDDVSTDRDRKALS